MSASGPDAGATLLRPGDKNQLVTVRIRDRRPPFRRIPPTRAGLNAYSVEISGNAIQPLHLDSYLI
jgi:hypothetical protein